LLPTIRPKVRGSEKLMTSNRKISIQFVQVGRILERMRGVGVEEAAAVGAEFLDGFLAGHRPTGDWSAAHRQGVDDLVVQVEVLDRAARDQDDGRNRSRWAAGCGMVPRTRSTQKLPRSLLRRRAKPRTKCHRNSDADRGRGEVLHGQTRHLHQMALVDSPE